MGVEVPMDHGRIRGPSVAPSPPCLAHVPQRFGGSSGRDREGRVEAAQQADHGRHETKRHGREWHPEANANLRELENVIERAVILSRGRVAGENGAARRLGLAASTLEFRVKPLDIDKFRFRTQPG
jgi:hypothetical protein